MANTKKSTKELLNEGAVNSVKDSEAGTPVSYPETAAEYPTMAQSDSSGSYLESDLWVPVIGDRNMRVLNVVNGSVIMKSVGSNFSLCYVPNVIYGDGQFKRI